MKDREFKENVFGLGKRKKLRTRVEQGTASLSSESFTNIGKVKEPSFVGENTHLERRRITLIASLRILGLHSISLERGINDKCK